VRLELGVGFVLSMVISCRTLVSDPVASFRRPSCSSRWPAGLPPTGSSGATGRQAVRVWWSWQDC